MTTQDKKDLDAVFANSNIKTLYPNFKTSEELLKYFIDNYNNINIFVDLFKKLALNKINTLEKGYKLSYTYHFDEHILNMISLSDMGYPEGTHAYKYRDKDLNHWVVSQSYPAPNRLHYYEDFYQRFYAVQTRTIYIYTYEAFYATKINNSIINLCNSKIVTLLKEYSDIAGFEIETSKGKIYPVAFNDQNRLTAFLNKIKAKCDVLEFIRYLEVVPILLCSKGISGGWENYYNSFIYTDIQTKTNTLNNKNEGELTSIGQVEYSYFCRMDVSASLSDVHGVWTGGSSGYRQPKHPKYKFTKVGRTVTLTDKSGWRTHSRGRNVEYRNITRQYTFDEAKYPIFSSLVKTSIPEVVDIPLTADYDESKLRTMYAPKLFQKTHDAQLSFLIYDPTAPVPMAIQQALNPSINFVHKDFYPAHSGIKFQFIY